MKLDSQPTANVTIPISSDNVSEGTVSVSSLTFTSVNWSAEQTVTVTGVDDSVVDDNVTYNIVVGPTTSIDSNYDGLDDIDISIININDDEPKITINAINYATTESGKSSFTVKLDTKYSKCDHSRK